MARNSVREAAKDPTKEDSVVSVVELGNDVLAEIARLLREAYGEIVGQGVTARHAELIDALSRQLDPKDEEK